MAGTSPSAWSPGFNTRSVTGDLTSNVLGGGALVGQVMIAVLGVLAMTSEYSSGLVRVTFAAIPRRPLVLAAKAAVFGTVCLAAGEWSPSRRSWRVAACVHGGVPRPSLSDPDVLRAVVMTGAYLALTGLTGLGIGAILRHGAAAITALVALVFVAPLAGLAATPVGPYLPELIYANSLGATKPVQGFTTSPWLASPSSPPTPWSCSPWAAGCSPAATPRLNP